MARPKVKIARALGIPLTSKAARIMERRPSLPGQHGQGRKRSPSVFKTQLIEKQRLKAIYNVSEKQLHKYYEKANRSEDNSGDVLLGLLETRVDSAIYRMGFASTIYAARQFVSHGHFEINGKQTRTPSQQLKPGVMVSVKEKSKTHPQIIEALTHSQNIQVPEYLEINKVQMSGKLISFPLRGQIPVELNEQLVIELYSK
ncbi:MAG: 30S ribosomal protein S4 [Fibrobacteria bacterium]|nr:30S ribosomal protein S4 [Fibrobacteria bacterium]